MSAPAVLIRLELEAAPRVYVETDHAEDELRLAVWFESRREYGELVARAVELAEEARAA